MPSKNVPIPETGEFVQSLLDGPDDFATQISVLPNYQTGKARVDYTWGGAPAAPEAAPAPAPAKAKAPAPPAPAPKPGSTAAKRRTRPAK
jgi:hypothetical protein